MKKLLKALKWALVAVAALVLLVAIALAAHPLWLGPAAKGVANAVVPDILGVKFDLSSLNVNLYGGHVDLADLRLWNPTNYSDEYAATLGRLSVDVDMGTVADDTVVVREVFVDGVYASYVKEGGRYNFDVIAGNAAGPASADAPARDEEPPAPRPASGAGSGKKVVVDHVLVRNVRVKYGYVTLSVPVDIELRGLGRESGGLTWEEAWGEILNGVLKALGSVADGIKSLGESATGVVTGAGEALKGVGSGIRDVGTSFTKASGSLKEAGGSLKRAGKDLGREIRGLFR